jgi:hypothetical protein
MSVGFGFSAGDFIAALKLVGTVIDALRESGDSRSTFRNLINELYLLESALLRVKRLELDDKLQVQKLALHQAASQCQRSIDSFWQKARKLQPHLQLNGTTSRVKDGWAKIKWAICMKDDVETFRAEVRGHTASIDMLLSTVQLEALSLEGEKRDLQHKECAGMLHKLSSQVMTKLSDIAKNVSNTVQQGRALLEASRQVVRTNLCVFSMIYDIQLFILKIPGQIQRQQPVYFTDPFNRTYPFYLEFIGSWEEFLALMRAKFSKTGCDTGLLDRNEFVIEEAGTQLVIDTSQPWDCCFFPGQRAGMSMIFKERNAARSKNSCPRCQAPNHHALDRQITWYVQFGGI